MTYYHYLIYTERKERINTMTKQEINEIKKLVSEGVVEIMLLELFHHQDLRMLRGW